MTLTVTIGRESKTLLIHDNEMDRFRPGSRGRARFHPLRPYPGANSRRRMQPSVAKSQSLRRLLEF
jgi:hypothetical protein